MSEPSGPAAGPGRRIGDLDSIVAALPGADRRVFDRIFRVDVALGETAPPASMLPWLEQQFGAVEPALRQRVVKVTNRATLSGTLFSGLRSSRPQSRGTPVDIGAELRAGPDPLADPESNTPADPFGRIRGEHCVTAGNIAKFDGLHGLVVFDEPHPLRFDRVRVRDYFATARRWMERAHAHQPGAVFPFVAWNCLWRAGASLTHGHLQVLLGAGAHYAAVERLRADAQRYGGAYFDDLFRAHAATGAGFRAGDVRVMASLTPVKEREVVLLADGWGAALYDRIFEVLAHLRDDLGVTSFNVGLAAPPLTAVEGWAGFPIVVRIVDRGPLTARTADIAAMELFAASVVGADPFELAAGLSGAMGVSMGVSL